MPGIWLRKTKDTKKSMTWWCWIAPMRPTMAMSRRKTPTAMTPPMMWMLDTKPKPFPHAATAMSSSPTSWGGERRKLTRVSWGCLDLIERGYHMLDTICPVNTSEVMKELRGFTFLEETEARNQLFSISNSLEIIILLNLLIFQSKKVNIENVHHNFLDQIWSLPLSLFVKAGPKLKQVGASSS